MNTATRPHARTITVGIDGSLTSRRAVCWAVDHAQAGDTIVLLHAWRRARTGTSDVAQVDDLTTAEHLVDHEAGRARILAAPKGVTVRGCAIEGHVDDVLAGADCDEIVIGLEHRSPLRRLVTHSPAAGIVRQARAPVTLVSVPKVR